MFVYGVIGDNFLFPSVGDSNDFAFVWIIPSARPLPMFVACRCRLAVCLRQVLRLRYRSPIISRVGFKAALNLFLVRHVPQTALTGLDVKL